MQNKTIYAGFFPRLAAYLLDLLILGVLLLLFRFSAWIASMRYPDAFIFRDYVFEFSIYDMILYVLTAVYYVVTTYLLGGSLGKKIFHLKVVGQEKKLTFGQILYRETIAKYLSKAMVFVGYFIAGFTEKKTALHDILSDTYVVYDYVDENQIYVELKQREMQGQNWQNYYNRQQFQPQEKTEEFEEKE